jgi:hypothetical protein
MRGTTHGGDAEQPSTAQPGVGSDPAPGGDQERSPSFTLEVGRELFAVRPDAFGGTDYTWVNGPNEGYGFGESPTPDRSLEEHRESIRAFLTQVDPATGYLKDD